MINPYDYTHIHKHLHYYYHYDAIGDHRSERTDRESYLSGFTCNNMFTISDLGSIFSTRTNWKKIINPQVAKLYDQITSKLSVQKTSPSQNLIQSEKQSQNLKISNWRKYIRSPYSRENLRKKIQEYERYIRQHSRPNLYIPNTPYLKKNLKHQLSLINQGLNEIVQNTQESSLSINRISVEFSTKRLLYQRQKISEGCQKQRKQIVQYDVKSDSRLRNDIFLNKQSRKQVAQTKKNQGIKYEQSFTFKPL